MMEDKIDEEDIKSLIQVRKNIFSRFREFLRNIFKNNNSKHIKQAKEENDTYKELINDPNFLKSFKEKNTFKNIEISENKERKETLSKEEFMNEYNNIKQNKSKIEDLSISDLIKMNILIKSEIEIKQKQLESNQKLRLEIEQLEKENDELMKKMELTEADLNEDE